ncbi:MAG TPA: hypothetical protein VK976_00640 [Verrucomicrobiae bacterium]|nr:hypothetical protein [Verrucomicrobiae bacterium]
MISQSPTFPSRAIPLSAILLICLAVHGPLLLMQLPASSYDANTHMFFAAHYAHHWFNPWNEKWFGGFSQTTYPPLTHQWIALFSHLMGLKMAYMFVQFLAILLLPIGMYRYAELWVDEISASYAALGSVFLGSLSMLVYQSGQLPTTAAAALTLNALPFFYIWLEKGEVMALLKGVAIAWAAAAAHHVTLLFGAVLFAIPVLFLALIDRNAAPDEEDHASAGGVLARAVVFALVGVAGVAAVLYPFWIALLKNPINQMPIPHGSRDNYILNVFSGINFWIIPMGLLILAIPFILLRGSADRRLRPLLFGWYLTTLLGLGGTTPVGKALLGRAYNVLTFERFTFWATLMAMPFVGLLAVSLIRRFRMKALVGLAIAAVITMASAVSWITIHPINSTPFNVDQVIAFLDRDDHSNFRYITLGFGSRFAEVSREAKADSIDGDYNSARLLPEMTAYGAGQLYNSKYFGLAGMESLRAVLKHANQYGLKYIFVRDRYYEPLLAFAGWRKAETYDNGNVTLWTKEDVPPARPLQFNGFRPTEMQGIMWGILPVGSSLFALFLVLLVPERRRLATTLEFPTRATVEPMILREAK